ncbi:MAG: outer membrane protein assembly factor BamD [Bacteriovoracaceae bacterium]|nr:outer membrane protein assembly factor BamD [Bacteriovoracaceae bacterium]
MRWKAILWFSILGGILALLVACSSVRPTGQTEAEILYKEAQSLTKSGRYLLAIEKLNNLRSHYPYSFYATSAELLMGEILYKQHNYIEAAGAFINFYDDHPTHPQLPYVLWMIAESFTAQNPSTSDRDLSTAIEANHFYRELIKRFPDAEQVPAAREKMQKNQQMLQEKAINIADFYYRTDKFGAALYRYQDFLQHFEEQKVRQHAILRAVACACRTKQQVVAAKLLENFKEELTVEQGKKAQEEYDKCRWAEENKKDK